LYFGSTCWRKRSILSRCPVNIVFLAKRPKFDMISRYVSVSPEVNARQARFYVGVVGNFPKSEPCPQIFWLPQQYAVLKPANTRKQLYRGRFCRVGVVHLAVWPVFRGRRLKKFVNFFAFLPIFPLEPPTSPAFRCCSPAVGLILYRILLGRHVVVMAYAVSSVGG